MNKQLKLLVISALFAAMTTVLTLFLKIPVGKGYIHLGDSIIYLAACILPAPYAIFVAGIGGALADAFGGYAIYIIPTFIIKALITMPYTSKKDTVLTNRNILSVIIASIITITGYSITGLLLYGWAGVLAGLLGDTIQAVGSAVVFLIFAITLDNMKFKQRIWQEK